MKYQIPQGEELTKSLILAYVNDFKRNRRTTLNKLYNYYQGKTDILNKTVSDITKPNNKIVNPFPKYISDTFTGYFMGEPISYEGENKDFLDEIKQLFNYNDEAEENSGLAQHQSIFGIAYELLYMDGDSNIRFKRISPLEGIVLYDDTLESNIQYFIRYYELNSLSSTKLGTDKREFVEVYSTSDITRYEIENSSFKFISNERHYFNDCPICVYENNDENMGDFEPVISLIDAYDKVNSCSLDDFEAFCDAYMILQGLEGTEAEDLKAMKENRVLLLPQGANAEWMIKTQPDAHIENIKNRYETNIHKFSKVPDLTDENFANNASGVAMKYKLMGLENATSIKERAFKKGLQRRIELINNIFTVKGSNYDYREISMLFTRNIPANDLETAELITKVQGLVSDTTLLNLLSFVEDADNEIEKRDSAFADDFMKNEEVLTAAAEEVEA